MDCLLEYLPKDLVNIVDDYVEQRKYDEVVKSLDLLHSRYKYSIQNNTYSSFCFEYDDENVMDCLVLDAVDHFNDVYYVDTNWRIFVDGKFHLELHDHTIWSMLCMSRSNIYELIVEEEKEGG